MKTNQSVKKKKLIIEQARNASGKDQLTQVILQLNLLISDSSTDTELLHARAQLFEKQQQWGKAINDYLNILTIDKNDKKALVQSKMLKTILKYNNMDIYSSPNTNNDPWFE